MNPTPDELFDGLAVKVAAGRATPEETAQLEAIIANEPRRAVELEKVKADVAFAGKLVPRIFEELTPVPPLSEPYRQRFMERVAAVFGPPRATPRQATELSPASMRQLILKVVSESRMDGFELCRRLREANIRIKDQPEATIYRILDDLELSGHLESEWVDRPSRRVKLYRLSQEIGWPTLRSEKVPEGIASLADAIKAYG